MIQKTICLVFKPKTLNMACNFLNASQSLDTALVLFGDVFSIAREKTQLLIMFDDQNVSHVFIIIIINNGNYFTTFDGLLNNRK